MEHERLTHFQKRSTRLYYYRHHQHHHNAAVLLPNTWMLSDKNTLLIQYKRRHASLNLFARTYERCDGQNILYEILMIMGLLFFLCISAAYATSFTSDQFLLHLWKIINSRVTMVGLSLRRALIFISPMIVFIIFYLCHIWFIIEKSISALKYRYALHFLQASISSSRDHSRSRPLSY